MTGAAQSLQPLLLLCVVFIPLTSQHQASDPLTNPHQPNHAQQNKLRGRESDPNHIKEHLDGVIDNVEMTKEEEQFHYFKLHDYDSNNMLDGIELIAALTDYHTGEDPSNNKPLSDEDFKQLVDTILEEDDHDKNGYIDYAEFIKSQRD